MSSQNNGITDGSSTNSFAINGHTHHSETSDARALDLLRGLNLLNFSDVTLSWASIRTLRRQAATTQSVYRDLGVRYYDLPAATQNQLLENNDNKITAAFAATPSSPEPEMMLLLNRASAMLDDVDMIYKEDRDEEALDILQTAANVLFRVRPDLMQAMTAVLDAQLTGTVHVNSQTRQAQAGLLPVAFLRWCKGLREVKVAIELGTLDGDDPHDILAFVVTEEERERPALDLLPRTPDNGTPWSEWLGDGVD